jgi:hypothetical protein
VNPETKRTSNVYGKMMMRDKEGTFSMTKSWIWMISLMMMSRMRVWPRKSVRSDEEKESVSRKKDIVPLAPDLNCLASMQGMCTYVFEIVNLQSGRAWDEIFEVFGDGTDYDWALDDEDIPQEEENLKGDLKFADVSTPFVLRVRIKALSRSLSLQRSKPRC